MPAILQLASTIIYKYTDAEGNMAKPVTREITVTDTTAPELTLLGSNPVTAAMGQTYAPSGATAKDTVDGDLTVISSYAPFPIKDLVSFWRFNEGTGEIVFDHIGNNHLEFAGSAQFSPEGIERGAVSANNNGSLLVDDNPSLDITDALSISSMVSIQLPIMPTGTRLSVRPAPTTLRITSIPTTLAIMTRNA